MRLTAILALACLFTLAFAGCSGKDKDDGKTSTTSSSHSSTSATSTSSSHSSTSTSATSTSTGPSNHAPTGSISVAVNGTRGNFTLNGTDADHDALAWTLTYGDGNSTNGTTLPATLSHNYTLPANVTAMNFTANFTITDGKAPVTYNVTVSVSGGAAATQSFAGSWTTGGPMSCAQYAAGANDPYDNTPPLEGIEWVKFDVTPGTAGLEFNVAVAPAAPAGGPIGLQFYDAAGVAGDYFNSGGPQNFDITGTVPANAAFAVLYPCAFGPGDFTYNAA